MDCKFLKKVIFIFFCSSLKKMFLSLHLLSEEEIQKNSSFSMNTTYDLQDSRFGSVDCTICKNKKCVGHYAELHLKTFVIHPFFASRLRDIMNEICHSCGKKLPQKRKKN